MSKDYAIALPGLAEAVAACKPAPGQKALVKTLRHLPGLEDLKLATTRGEDGVLVVQARRDSPDVSVRSSPSLDDTGDRNRQTSSTRLRAP